MSRKLAFVLVAALIMGCNGTTPKEVTIVDGQPQPWTLHVTKGGRGRAPDVVVWRNRDRTAHSVIFGQSPFGRPDLRISISGNGRSAEFTVDRGTPPGRYTYELHSPALSDSGPGPVVIVEEESLLPAPSPVSR
jgi:hypothetical protein